MRTKILGLVLFAVAIVSACGRRSGVPVADLSQDVYLNGKGFFVLSNDAGYLAIDVLRGNYPHVSIKTYVSTNGNSWVGQHPDWVVFRIATNIVLGSESAELSWEESGRTRMSGMFLTKTGIATATNANAALLSVSNLKFTQPRANTLENTVKEAIR